MRSIFDEIRSGILFFGCLLLISITQHLMGLNLFSRIHGDFTRRLLVSLRPIRKMLDVESEERPIKRAKMEATKESSPLVLDGAELAIKTDEEMALPVDFSKSYTPPLDYRNKLVLAPMVRSGTCEYRN